MPSLTTQLTAAGAGILFGIALEKGGMSQPLVIYNQMAFKSFNMMKMFLSAAAFSALSHAIVNKWLRPGLNAQINKKKDASPRGLASIAIGGALVGAGMALSGSCPGTVLVQIGTNVPSALWTFAGGLAGTLAYTFFEATWEKTLFRLYLLDKDKQYLQDYYSAASFEPLATAFACLLALVAIALDRARPWKEDYGLSLQANTTFADITAIAWAPWLAGSIIGLLQVPVMLLISDSLGSSTSYLSLVAKVASVVAPDTYNCSQSMKGAKDHWQVYYVAAAIVGGYYSAKYSGHDGAAIAGMPPLRAFVGGFLSLLGSRIGHGCTSGHGISGMGALRLRSFVSVAAMFIGGFITARLFPVST